MIALLLVIGCAHPLPAVTRPIAPQSPELAEMRAVVEAWEARGDLPWLDADDLRTLLVTDPPDVEGMQDLCPNAFGGCLASWNRCVAPFAGLLCGSDRLAVIGPTYPDGRPLSAGSRLSLLRHEIVHRAAEVAGISDNDHHDRRLWYLQRFPDPDLIVEGRARARAQGGN